ncbi:MAG TPA: metallophosphoesterase [Gemmatimonadaceae bacterium]|nr:metallophosphoesterase [Gemmatimonadaceae bacterium]
MTRFLCIVFAAAAARSLCAQPALERVRTPVRVQGVVFVDRNNNGSRDANEPGIGGVAVSDQMTVAVTDSTGRFTLDAAGYGVVSVTQPNGYAVRGPFWRRVSAGQELSFPLTLLGAMSAFSFVHASDTHISPESAPRMRRLKALVDSLRPAFVLISGDLVRDALRTPESEARGYYDLFVHELESFTVPVFTVPGNHEIFGIERHRSLVSPEHPLYGKRFYRSVLGPNYYSFEYGGVHFMGLDTVDYDDLWYYGHVDSLQMAWIKRDVERLPANMPVVTFNHIPMVSAAQIIDGYDEESVAPTVIRLPRRPPEFRHAVQNTSEILDVLGDRLEIALGGHMHRREFLRYETASGTRRFSQTAAVVGPVRGEGKMGIRSGITLYRVSDRHVDDGTFIPLER